MKRAGKPATYGLETFRDVLEKLEWEQNELKAAFEQEPKDPTKLYYRAFNAAVTAWQLADWVWKDMTPDQRQKLEKDWRKPSLAALKHMSNNQAEEYLTSLPGVGIKTARCVLLYSLNREVFPADVNCLNEV